MPNLAFKLQHLPFLIFLCQFIGHVQVPVLECLQRLRVQIVWAVWSRFWMQWMGQWLLEEIWGPSFLWKRWAQLFKACKPMFLCCSCNHICNLFSNLCPGTQVPRSCRRPRFEILLVCFSLLLKSAMSFHLRFQLCSVAQVPYWQNKIVQGCRKRGKPVIVATNMLESMIQNPTPTRAEVSDIAIAVREGADAVMLSGETAYGKFPFKAVSVMSTVARRTEQAMLSYQVIPHASPHKHFGSESHSPICWTFVSLPDFVVCSHWQHGSFMDVLHAFWSASLPWAMPHNSGLDILASDWEVWASHANGRSGWLQGQRKYGSDESEPIDWIIPPGRTTTEPGVMSTPGLSEMFAYHSTSMANTIRTSLIVFSRLVTPISLLKNRLLCVQTLSEVLHW